MLCVDELDSISRDYLDRVSDVLAENDTCIIPITLPDLSKWTSVRMFDHSDVSPFAISPVAQLTKNQSRQSEQKRTGFRLHQGQIRIGFVLQPIRLFANFVFLLARLDRPDGRSFFPDRLDRFFRRDGCFDCLVRSYGERVLAGAPAK